MKKSMFSILAILCFFIFTNTTFKPVQSSAPQTEEIQQGEPEALWLTPTGFLIPFSESENWREYVQSQLNVPDFIDLSGHPRPIVRKHYSAFSCVIENSRCSFRCARSTTAGSCIKKTACAPCINCC